MVGEHASPILPALMVPAGSVSLMNLHLRDGHDEFATPFANETVLLDDLVFQVPGKDQQEIRLRLPNPIRRINRDVRAGQESAMLVGIAVHGIVEKISSDSAVIQQRIAFAWRPIPRDLFPAAFRLNQEFEQLE